MTFEIQFFGTFEARRGEEAAAFATHPTQNLAAFLAFHPDRAHTREELASRIWPSVDAAKSQNRLRTALVHLKQALDPWQPVRAERQAISFVAEGCELDIDQAERLHRRSRLAQGMEEERRLLEDLLGIIGRDFLEGWTEEWTIAPRHLWRAHRSQAALRLGNICLDLGLSDLARQEAERVFEVDPFHEEAWALYFRAMIENERGREASERFRAARRQLRDEMDFDFSPELIDLSRRVSSGQITKKPAAARLSSLEKDVVSRAFEGQLADDPYTLLPIMTGEAFRSEAMQYPLETWRLIKRVVEATEGTESERVSVMVLGVQLADMVDDLETGLDYGEWLIENLPESHPVYGRTLSSLGFLLFEVRDWDSAKKYIQRHIELTELHGSPADHASARCQMASLLWHEGDLDRAESIYLECAKITMEDTSIRGRYNSTIIGANLGYVTSIRQEWDRAEKFFERAHAAAVANKFDYVRNAVLAPLGAARMVNGREQGARQLVSHSFAQTYRSRYRRMNQIAADYAAIALAQIGHQKEGMAVLDQFTKFRHRDRHERSVAEDKLAQWTREVAGNPPPDTEWMSLQKPSEVIARTCDLLDQIT